MRQAVLISLALACFAAHLRAAEPATGGGLKSVLPDGWQNGTAAAGELSLTETAGPARVRACRLARKTAANPAQWARAYVKYFVEAEGRKALVAGVEPKRVAGKLGATASFSAEKPGGDAKADKIWQRLYVIPSKEADQVIVVICSAPSKEFRKYAKTFDQILDALEEQ
ncbi:MAG: hypothetical protein HS116_03195 [Planctomycetes bacterium]|nr:hypothetical protein [Planctomycetota bacterium]